MPDPYAPAGVRDPAASGGWSAAAGPTDSGKQWPPVTGAAGLPRRIPGATTEWRRGWAPDRSALLGVAGETAADASSAGTGVEEHPETKPVPTRWTAAGRRSAPEVPAGPAGSASPTGAADPADDPDLWAARSGDAGTASHQDLNQDLNEDLNRDRYGGRYTADPDEGAPDGDLPGGHLYGGDLHEHAPDDAAHSAAHDDAAHDDEDLGDPHDELRGPAAERTEVIWRAPGLDAPVAPAPLPEPGADLLATSLAPYTGARPRRFAAPPTDVPVQEAADSDDGPGSNRVRIVLSERRSTAHSSRGLSDVQDPGAVGTLLRNSLVRTQLLLALRVSLVALFTLGMLPVLFMALPVLGEIEVAGIRLPWLLLGLLVYPFLLGLGWWYVRSAESVEQDFADDVADR